MKLHEYLLTQNLPKLYETDGDKTALFLVKFVLGKMNWFIKEYNPEQKIAYGFANLNDPEMAELGNISIEELEQSFPIPVKNCNGKTNTWAFRVYYDDRYKPQTLDQIKADMYKDY